MNVKELHAGTKEISTVSLFKTVEGTITSLQILANGQLKEHITKVPALLVCLSGEVTFENEQGAKVTLLTGDYILIEPQIKHWIHANATSNLLLIK